MNDIIDYEEGKESCVDDPAFGGTMKILTTSVNESTLKFNIDHSKMGKSEVIDVYTDEGITITTTHQSGATITEEWYRLCCEEGAYRYQCTSGCGFIFSFRHFQSFLAKMTGNHTWPNFGFSISEEIKSISHMH